MSRHGVALIFYGFGISALIFTTIRTYYLNWKRKKDSDTQGDQRRFRK